MRFFCVVTVTTIHGSFSGARQILTYPGRRVKGFQGTVVKVWVCSDNKVPMAVPDRYRGNGRDGEGNEAVVPISSLTPTTVQFQSSETINKFRMKLTERARSPGGVKWVERQQVKPGFIRPACFIIIKALQA